MNTNNIGLPLTESQEISDKLNILLSNFEVYYQTLRGLHWNIKGRRFFDLHLKFEELYTDTQVKIDLIAERILTLGGVPFHTFEDYLKHNLVVVGKDINNDEKAIEIIKDSIQKILPLERQIMQMASDIQDEGTQSMISDFVREQEKTLWMLNAWLAL